MNYVTHQNTAGVETKEIPCIPGSGAPTSATEGAVGCLYMDTLTGKIYRCTSAAGGVYSWQYNIGDTGPAGTQGPQGYTPVKGVDYFDGEDGQPGKDGTSPTVSVTAIEGGHRITITDASGTKTVDVMDGADGQPGVDGYTPQKGVDYFDGAAGKDGASVTVKSVSESTADGGSNVVNFSDGTTLTVKNGSKGKDGAAGKDAPQESVLYTAQTLSEKQKAQARANSGSWSEKKLLFMGDSITASSSGWVTQISKILNPALSVNLAVNGAWWNDKEGTVYDGNPVFEGADNNINNVIGNQVEKILRGKDTANANYSEVADYAEFDMIFIAAGTNGSTPSEDIETAFYADGSIVPVASVDRTTWAGAFRYCVEELQRVYPDAKIFICTPIQGAEQTRAYATIKARGDYLKQLCARMSVICIDTMQCGVCGLFEVANANGRDLRDGLHTNASGALKMAKYNAAAVMAHYASEGYVADDTEEEEDPNLVPLSVDIDGNIYNGVGYRNDTYISSSSPLGYSTKSGYVSTGFISAENGDVLYASGTAEWDASDSSCRAFVYDADKNLLGYKQGGSNNSEMNATYGMEVTNTWYNNSTGQNVSPTNIKFIRFALKGTGDGLIIRKSPIV